MITQTKKTSVTTQQLNGRAGKVNRTAPKSKRDKEKINRTAQELNKETKQDRANK